MWTIYDAKPLKCYSAERLVYFSVQIPIALFGLMFFDARWSLQNVGSVLVGLAAGVIFVRAKQLGAA